LSERARVGGHYGPLCLTLVACAIPPLALSVFSFPPRCMLCACAGAAESVHTCIHTMDYVGAFLPSNRSLAVVGSDQVSLFGVALALYISSSMV